MSGQTFFGRITDLYAQPDQNTVRFAIDGNDQVQFEFDATASNATAMMMIVGLAVSGNKVVSCGIPTISGADGTERIAEIHLWPLVQ